MLLFKQNDYQNILIWRDVMSSFAFFNTHPGPSSNLLQLNTEQGETSEFNSPK